MNRAMVTIFEFENYKSYVNAWLRSRPKQGRGEFLRMAKHLNVHPTLVSHIFRGDKELNGEQASLLAEYFSLTEIETDYFIALVQEARAGTPLLKRVYQRQRKALLDRASKIVHRLNVGQTLDDDAKATFYSSWHYSAVRLLTSIEGFQKEETLAAALKIEPKRLTRVLKFLLAHGLCRQQGNRFVSGPTLTHLDSDSPFTPRHHANWRLKAMERHVDLKKSEVCFTAPMTLSLRDAEKIRNQLIDLVQGIKQTVEKSPGETLYCLGFDWIKVV